MFIKNLEKAYVYRMLLSFKTSVICKKKNLISRRATAAAVEQVSSDTTRYFARNLPEANIQAYDGNQS